MKKAIEEDLCHDSTLFDKLRWGIMVIIFVVSGVVGVGIDAVSRMRGKPEDQKRGRRSGSASIFWPDSF